MNIYAQVAFVPHRHRTLWAAAKMFSLAALPLLFPLFPLFLRIFSAPLFALPSRTFRWCSGWWGGWVVGWLGGGSVGGQAPAPAPAPALPLFYAKGHERG